MKIFYFGPYREKGHFLYGPGGYKARSTDEKLLPPCFEFGGDGMLQQNCVFKFMRWTREGAENEGEALLHYREGWSALSFWDRTVDKRGACNSTVFADGAYGFAKMIELALDNFPSRWEMIKFPIVPAEIPNNSLICEKAPGFCAPHCRMSGDEKLNTCAICNKPIAKWKGQWISIDSWSHSAILDGRRIEE